MSSERVLRKDIISSIASDELTKLTRRLTLLQMLAKHGRIQPENLFFKYSAPKCFKEK